MCTLDLLRHVDLLSIFNVLSAWVQRMDCEMPMARAFAFNMPAQQRLRRSESEAAKSPRNPNPPLQEGQIYTRLMLFCVINPLTDLGSYGTQLMLAPGEERRQAPRCDAA